MKLYKEDINENNLNRAAWEAQKQRVQSAVTLYAGLDLAPLVGNELMRLFTDTDNLLYDKLTNKENASVQIGTEQRLPITRQAALQLMDKPAEWNQLKNLLVTLIPDMVSGSGVDTVTRWAKMAPTAVCTYFTVDESFTVAFTTLCQQQIDNYGKLFVQSDAATAVATFFETIEQAFAESGLLNNPYIKSDPGELIVNFTDGWNASTGKFRRNGELGRRDREITNMLS